MTSRVLYTAIAVIGIGAASGAAWWYQNQPRNPPKPDAASAPGAASPAPAGAASGPGTAGGGAGGPARPAAVEVARVEVTRLVDDTQAVGSLRSRQGVMVRPEVSGRITQLNFRDGDRVRKGQLLVQLDDTLQVAQIKQAEAELSIARANHKRNQELVAQGFISQRSVDESAANLEVAQAKLSLAQANAARLRITAPFDGMTGIRSANPGDYLKDGADIVNIEDIDAVFVDFRLPERFQTKVRRGQTAAVEIDALPGRKFNALVQAIDPLIDANGRSIAVRGCIDNRQMQLRPGMFARVNAVFGEREQAMVIPEEAIVPFGGRQFVIKVVDGADKDSKVSQRVEVKIGIRRPGQVEIVEGLSPGETVVVAGQQRLQRDGSPVRVIDVPRGPGGPGGAGSAGGAGGPGAQAAAGAPGGARAPGGPGAVASAPGAPGKAAGGPGVAGGGSGGGAGGARNAAGAGRPGGPGAAAGANAAQGPNPCAMELAEASRR
ncbi:MAG: efflux RND transporter periplasmic adaptor subunit [Burkholderiaceae bacterium]